MTIICTVVLFSQRTQVEKQIMTALTVIILARTVTKSAREQIARPTVAKLVLSFS